MRSEATQLQQLGWVEGKLKHSPTKGHVQLNDCLLKVDT